MILSLLLLLFECERARSHEGFYGVFLQAPQNQTAASCQGTCITTDECQYFSFNKSGCYLWKCPGGSDTIAVTYSENTVAGYSARNCNGRVVHAIKNYTLVRKSKNWTDAEAYCKEHHTNLAIIHTDDEWKAAEGILIDSKGSEDRHVWIGLRNDTATEKWVWADGENVMYFNWHYNVVNQDYYACAISTSSFWHPVSEDGCVAQKHYVCQYVSHMNGATEKVFELIRDARNQKDAKKHCEVNDADLASIANQKEQTAFDEVTTAESWIGLERDGGLWKWSSGEPFFADDKWLHSSSNGKCIKINSDYLWEQDDCSTENHFLCYEEKHHFTNITDTLNTSNSTYLRFFSETKTWIDAYKFCLSNNSILVHVTNKTVQDDIDRLLEGKAISEAGVWIGLERSIFGWEAPWVWTDGADLGFHRWHSRFPLNPLNQHCGKMVYEDEELKWLDGCCFQRLPFICQERRD